MIAACFGSALYGQRIVLVHRGEALSTEAMQIKGLVEWSGLSLETIQTDTLSATGRKRAPDGEAKVLAVFVEADSLSGFGAREWKEVSRGSAAPVMVFGIDEATDAKTLQRLSGGGVLGCERLGPVETPKALHVFDEKNLTPGLSGIDLPAVDAPVCRLVLNGQQAKVVLAYGSSDGQAKSQASPAALIEVSRKEADIFFVPRRQALDGSWQGRPDSLSEAFSSLAPFLIFLHRESGEYAWHLDGHYANFTVDDPWLTEPYGNLDYRGLLAEMQRHRFHTTIAFVPWNYDRSDGAIAELFRSNPEYLSVSLHGNNHLHREFGGSSEDPPQRQEADIRQAIARMERFRQMTGVSYDRFMVFPHGVSPQGTFGILEKYNFLGTANSLDVPLDAPFPKDPLFLLRPYTTRYANLLSLSRYSVEAPLPKLDLAIEQFLGNPVLLYGHQAFFARGTGSFSPIAESLNRSQPETRWVGLGDLARHMYEMRLRPDGAFDVRMLSSEMALTNPTEMEKRYFVTAANDRPASLQVASRDGTMQPVQWDQAAGTMEIRIPAHASRILTLAGANDLDLPRQPIGKTSLRAYALRYLSDFRDMQLSRIHWGRSVVDAYYKHDGDTLERDVETRWFPVALAFAAALGLFVSALLWRKHRSIKQDEKMSATPSC